MGPGPGYWWVKAKNEPMEDAYIVEVDDDCTVWCTGSEVPYTLSDYIDGHDFIQKVKTPEGC